MISLSHGCSCSELAVYPKNWQTKEANTSEDWYIYYRFYDPNFREDTKYKYGKLVVIKAGINRLKTVPERRLAVKELMAAEMNLLQNECLNPITKQKVQAKKIDDYSSMPFSDALEFAYKQKQMEPHTKEDVASVLRYVKQAITAEGMNGLMISQVERKHIKMLLDRCGQIKTTWTNNTFNQYRKYLNILFGELMQYDAIQNNPITGIKKMKSLIKTRTVLSKDERKKVSHSLKTDHYSFWRFLQIFFHSGARITELVAVRVSQVDLKRQTFKVIVKKGKEQREVVKPIKNVAMLYWRELLKDAPAHAFVFGEGLVPELRDKPIRPEQITRRWKRHVKMKLGIQADFYSLKHLNTDETAALLGIEAAAAQNSHTTTVITMKHYAIGEKARQMERLKKVGNTFA